MADDDNEAGCCFVFLGLIIVSCVVGALTHRDAYGWLTFGVGLIAIGLISVISVTVTRVTRR